MKLLQIKKYLGIAWGLLIVCMALLTFGRLLPYDASLTQMVR